MKPLSDKDARHLEAAQGWLELGCDDEANNELEEITPQNRAHPDALEVRWHIYAHAKKWDVCVDLANAIVKLAPGNPDGWIHRSYSLHELKRTQEAFDQLLPVARSFPDQWTIPYNLACYCAQTGRLDECREWFKEAMAIDEEAAKESAIEDPDLKPLWDDMMGTTWKLA